MIDLFAGTVFMGISVFVYLMLRWGTRKPKEPAWMNEALVANLYTPLLVGALAFGICFFIKFAVVLGA